MLSWSISNENFQKICVLFCGGSDKKFWLMLWRWSFLQLDMLTLGLAVQVISWRVVLWADETSMYTCSRFCTVNCPPLVSNYQFPTYCLGFEPPTSEVGGECVTTAPHGPFLLHAMQYVFYLLFSDHKKTPSIIFQECFPQCNKYIFQASSAIWRACHASMADICQYSYWRYWT